MTAKASKTTNYLSQDPAHPVNFLVSSAGRRGELVNILRSTINDLGATGSVYAIDRSPLTAAGNLADELALVPRATDDDFIPRVLGLAQDWQVDHLIPTIDTELPAYAANHAAFASIGTSVWVSSSETIQIAMDKRLTNCWLRQQGFPCADQWEPRDAQKLAASAFPLIAKPANGSSSIGITKVNSREDLRALDPSFDYVVESIAEGHEFTVDVLVPRAGECAAAVPRRRLETRGGEVSKGMTVADGEVAELASAVAERLPGAFGILNIQIMKDPGSGSMSVIEINARIGGGFPLTFASGAGMIAWMVETLHGITPTSSLLWRPGELMLRYDQGVYLSDQLSLLE